MENRHIICRDLVYCPILPPGKWSFAACGTSVDVMVQVPFFIRPVVSPELSVALIFRFFDVAPAKAALGEILHFTVMLLPDFSTVVFRQFKVPWLLDIEPVTP